MFFVIWVFSPSNSDENKIAFLVALTELAVITRIRHRYMETPIMSAATQVALGGALVFGTGVLIGSF